MNGIKRIYRRWRARKWRCRCGSKVFDPTALMSHPWLSGRDNRCEWHESVKNQVLSGKITRPEDAR